jgi:hypothetical protein
MPLFIVMPEAGSFFSKWSREEPIHWQLILTESVQSKENALFVTHG